MAGNGRVWKRLPAEGIHRLRDGDVVCADALDFLQQLRPGIADIVFLDPPFNLGKSYGSSSAKTDKKKEQDYADSIAKVLRRSAELLKDGGALYLYHIPRWAIEFGHVLGEFLDFRHWIAISMKNGFVRGEKLYPAHYALLYYTKGKPQTFTRPKIPALTCPHCSKYVRDYGGYKHLVQDGINLADIWDDLSPVRHKKHKNRSCNELPLEIPRRAVQISGPKGGLLVDPYAGSGTALLAAKEQGMRFVGCDRERQFFHLMKDRLT